MPLRPPLDSAARRRETSPPAVETMRWDWKALVAVMLAAIVAGWFLTRSVHEPTGGGSDDDADVDTDLADLSRALRDAANAEIDLIPRESAGIHFPTVIKYRRPVDFWQPLLGHPARGGRQR